MRSGSKPVIFGLLLAAGLLCSATLTGAEKPAKGTESYSVVAGTVFREPGFALPEAEVTLSPLADDQSGKKPKKMSFNTNTRGEFAFRLRSVKARYLVSASAKGYVRQEKEVEVQADERVDVTFTLARESNK